MGINYYWYANAPGTTECPQEPLHIGKSSAGWVFSLRVHPDLEIRNLADWQGRWKTGVIKDGYDSEVPVADMLTTITKRAHPRGLRTQGRDDHAHRLIEAGEPTYALYDYEFS